jgi:UDP-N-acetyl-D-mannosaminuronate dehydrogenase
MPIKIVERLFKTYKNKNLKKITILGVAYKKNVDDARETPAEHIYTELISRGCEVKAHDPFVKEWIHPIEKDLQKCMDWAEAIILVTDHDLYKGLRIDKPFIDTRNLL